MLGMELGILGGVKKGSDGNNSKAGKTYLSYTDEIPLTVQSRINVAKGQTRFSIIPKELEVILQSENTIQSSVKAISGGQFVRTVDTGKMIGNTALKFGGNETTWIQVFTDKSGNLITTYPVSAPN